MTTAKQIFVNLPVKDLNKTVEFFTKIGFEFNPQFTDENATCMVIGENIYAMFLIEPFFSTFIRKPIAEAPKVCAVINAFGVGSRAEVDEIVDKAMAAGAKNYREADDHGWMYGRSFEDINGHLWEFSYMDMSALPQE